MANEDVDDIKIAFGDRGSGEMTARPFSMGIFFVIRLTPLGSAAVKAGPVSSTASRMADFIAQNSLDDDLLVFHQEEAERSGGDVKDEYVDEEADSDGDRRCG